MEVMNVWDELAEDFGIDLSADDFPDINSIEELRKRLSRP
jgi:acyl carrier protein